MRRFHASCDMDPVNSINFDSGTEISVASFSTSLHTWYACMHARHCAYVIARVFGEGGGEGSGLFHIIYQLVLEFEHTCMHRA